MSDGSTLNPGVAPSGAIGASFEAALHSTFYRVPLGMAMARAHADGRFLECNQAFCSMLGHSRAELLANQTAGITHPEDRTRNRAPLEQLLRREVPHFVMKKRYITEPGAALWVRTSVACSVGSSSIRSSFMR